MNAAIINGQQRIIVLGQNVAEAPLSEDFPMMSLIRPETRACEICGRDTFVTRPSLNIAGSRLFLVCIGCAGEATERITNADPEMVEQMKRLSAAYRIGIVKFKGGEG